MSVNLERYRYMMKKEGFDEMDKRRAIRNLFDMVPFDLELRDALKRIDIIDVKTLIDQLEKMIRVLGK